MSTHQLAVIEGGSEIERTAEAWNQDRVELLKRTIAKGASDDELSLFVETCKRTGLNPFMRQIHAVKRWDNQEKREVMSIQVGIDGFRLIAERTGVYLPGREPDFRHDETGHLIAATAYVRRWSKNEWHEIAATAYYEEYVQTNRDGQPNAMWKRMPRAMLSKCAESLALRRAFPAEMSGLYSQEEMGQAENPIVQTPAGPVHRQTGEILPPQPAESPAQPAEPVDAEREGLIRHYGALRARAKALGSNLAKLTPEMDAEELRGMIEVAEAKVAGLEQQAAAAEEAPEAPSVDPFSEEAQAAE